MEIKVLGCHGGETPKHRTSCFLINGRTAVDAGALTSTLHPEQQLQVESVIVSHAHFDHVKDLATLADNRCQQGGPPFTIWAIEPTLDALRQHFFNDQLWPDFSKIPSTENPTVIFKHLSPEKKQPVNNLNITPILTNHSVDCSAFLIEDENGIVAYSGDTGPTDRFWQVLSETENLKAVIVETSFPDEQKQLAYSSGHHTPQTLAKDLEKFKNSSHVPILIFHIKPIFEDVVEKQLQNIQSHSVQVLRLGDHLIF